MAEVFSLTDSFDDDDRGPQPAPVVAASAPPAAVDRYAAVRTVLKRRRLVAFPIHDDDTGDLVDTLWITSMSAAARSDYLGEITEVIDPDNPRGVRLMPLHRKLLAATVLAPDKATPFFVDDAEIDEIDADLVDRMVEAASEINGLATGSQKISTEEDIAGKD